MARYTKVLGQALLFILCRLNNHYMSFCLKAANRTKRVSRIYGKKNILPYKTRELDACKAIDEQGDGKNLRG